MQEFLMSTWSIVLTAAVGYLVTNSRDSKKSRKKLEEKKGAGEIRPDQKTDCYGRGAMCYASRTYREVL